jgi:hypothetical protein
VRFRKQPLKFVHAHEGPKQNFFKPPHDGYKKTQNFMLISKNLPLFQNAPKKSYEPKKISKKIYLVLVLDKKVDFGFKKDLFFIHNVS